MDGDTGGQGDPYGSSSSSQYAFDNAGAAAASSDEAQLRAKIEHDLRMQMMGEAKMRQQEQELKRLQETARMKARTTHTPCREKRIVNKPTYATNPLYQHTLLIHAIYPLHQQITLRINPPHQLTLNPVQAIDDLREVQSQDEMNEMRMRMQQQMVGQSQSFLSISHLTRFYNTLRTLVCLAHF